MDIALADNPAALNGSFYVTRVRSRFVSAPVRNADQAAALWWQLETDIAAWV
ncbi:MAG: hypothetical protein SPI77_03680 [Corynebacterium sp.]|nr:hypothetical protein [Corynebacterium sp.]